MTGIQKEQIAIFCLFLWADGRKSAQEHEKLEKICKEMGVKKAEWEEIAVNCQNALYLDESNDNSAQIRQLIKTMNSGKNPFDPSDTPYLSYLGYGNLKDDKKEQLITLWNLLNLAYSDEEYSVPEKKIVHFLCDLWGVDKSLFNEISDCVETLVSLYNQKAWCEANITDGAVWGKRNPITGISKIDSVTGEVKTGEEEKKDDKEEPRLVMRITMADKHDFYKHAEEINRDIQRVIESVKLTINEMND